MKCAMIFFLCILVVLSGMADAPFVLPDNVSVVATNTTGKTWRMNGSSTNRVDGLKKQFKLNIQRSGWKFLHEMPMNKEKDRFLVAWKKGDENLILMIWPLEGGGSGFSWGIGK